MRFAGAAAMWVGATLAVAQPVPSARVLLDAWRRSDAEARTAIRSYRLDGRFRADAVPLDPIEQARPLEKMRTVRDGTWRAARSGPRYRWEFRVPATDIKILAFDGSRYWTFNQADPKGSDAGGSVVKNYEKAFGEKPQEGFLAGGTAVYPITLEHFVSGPKRYGNESKPLADRYLPYLRRLTVRRREDAALGAVYRMELPSRTTPILPETIEFAVFEGRFVPVRILLHDRFAAPREIRQETFIEGYRRIAGVPVPTRVRGDLSVRGPQGERIVIQRTRAEIEVSSVNADLPISEFQIAYPRGAMVYDDARGSAERVGGEAAAPAAPVVATTAPTDPRKGLLIGLGTVLLALAGMRWWRRRTA